MVIDLAQQLFSHCGLLPDRKEEVKRVATELEHTCAWHRIGTSADLLNLVSLYARASRFMKEIEERGTLLKPPGGSAA